MKPIDGVVLGDLVQQATDELNQEAIQRAVKQIRGIRLDIYKWTSENNALQKKIEGNQKRIDKAEARLASIMAGEWNALADEHTPTDEKDGK